MDLSHFLNLLLIVLLIFFFSLLIITSILSVQILIILKRVLSKVEYHLDNLKITGEEIKIKILDIIESILKKFRGHHAGKATGSEGGEVNAKEKGHKEIQNS